MHAQCIGIAAHLLLHAQGGIERPLGMIFMGNRRAEQGKDAIAQRLRHIAFIAMHGIHHELQGGINNRSRFFGIESFDQRGGAFEIGKQRGDRFALAIRCTARFHRRLLGADTLGEMRAGCSPISVNLTERGMG